jgi:hypothetical protein
MHVLYTAGSREGARYRGGIAPVQMGWVGHFAVVHGFKKTKLTFRDTNHDSFIV